MSPTILVTSAAHPTALYLLSALRDEPLTLLACADSERAAGLRLLREDRRFVVHGSNSPERIGDLLSICLRQHVDLLVATDMAEVPALARARELFERLGTRVWLDAARSTVRPITASQLVAACRPITAGRLLRSVFVRSA